MHHFLSSEKLSYNQAAKSSFIANKEIQGQLQLLLHFLLQQKALALSKHLSKSAKRDLQLIQILVL